MNKSLYQETVPVKVAVGNSGYCELDIKVKFYAEKIDNDVFVTIKSIYLDIENETLQDDVSSYLEEICKKQMR
jgi:hypothetical protein